ncbi:hypothetical protein GCM10017673_50380 [Streptosporangium violaceochromogenes]|nr:hypothetical protein GCM10017673_50380 [Streptosporangium violaceochromogenes]
MNKSQPAVSRRGFLGMAAGAAAVAGLAACGKSGGGTGGGGSGKSLTFWHPYTEQERQNAIRAIADKFTQETGTAVTVEVVPFANFAEKWPAAQAGRTLPDVAVTTAENALGMHSAKAIEPMDDIVKALGGDSAFVGGLVDKIGRYDGKVLALPHYVHDRLLFHRTDRLKAAGLPKPVTWEDTMEAAIAMTKAPEYYGYVQQLSVKDTGGGYLLWILARSNGGHLFDKDGKVTLNSPEVMEAIEFITKLGKKTAPSTSATTPMADSFALLNSGRSSMMVTAAAGMSSALSKAPQIAAVLDAGRMPKKKQYGDLIGAVSFVTPKGRNPEEGQKFVEFLYRKENYISFLHSLPLFMFPALTAASGPEFYNQPTLQKYRSLVDTTLAGIKNGDNPGFDFGPTPLSAPFFASHAVETMLQETIFGGVSLDKAVASATKTAQLAIDNVKSRTGG